MSQDHSAKETHPRASSRLDDFSTPGKALLSGTTLAACSWKMPHDVHFQTVRGTSRMPEVMPLGPSRAPSGTVVGLGHGDTGARY